MREKHPLEIAYKNEKELRKSIRILAIIFMELDGKTAHETAQLLRLDDHTVAIYQKNYETGGLPKLLEIGTSPGCPSQLNSEQKSELKAHIEQVWFLTSKEICDFVSKKYGITYTPNSMTGLLKKLGFTYKKPKIVPSKANRAEQEKFLQEVLRPTIARASGENPVYFMDATHLQHNSEPAYGWILKGKNKELKSNTGRRRININGAYCVHDKSVIQRADETINAVSVIALFGAIEEANPDAKTITIFMDNARYNRAKMVQEYLKRSRINVVYLPSYSPNLALIERLWLMLKKNVLYNKFFETFEEFLRAVNEFFDSLKARSGELATLMAPNFQLLGQ